MSKKLFIGGIVTSILLYSASAFACPYCNGNYDHRYNSSEYRQNSTLSKSIRDFDDKRYELNKLYDDGVADSDEKVKSLIKELDTLSSQIQQEEDKQYSRRYSDQGRGHGNHRRCW